MSNGDYGDRGNKDASITNTKGTGTLKASPGPGSA